MRSKLLTLRSFNNLLTVIVILFGLYLLLAPFMGDLALWYKNKTNPGGYVYQSKLLSDEESDDKKDVPKDNRLVIPGIQLNDQIVEGTDASVLKNGVWHRPGTSTPEKGGNTVIAGHRFTYANGASFFYNLDKVKVGDNMSVYWNQEEYVYKVKDIITVSPFDTYVENNTVEPLLTLYTCTPLWNPVERLVVQAERIDI